MSRRDGATAAKAVAARRLAEVLVGTTLTVDAAAVKGDLAACAGFAFCRAGTRRVGAYQPALHPRGKVLWQFPLISSTHPL